MRMTSESEEDCVRAIEGEAWGEEEGWCGVERLCDGCDGAEAMVGRFWRDAQDGCYCMAGVLL
jgi:hypothetical protein